MSQQTPQPRLGRGLSSLIRSSTISETDSPEYQPVDEPAPADVSPIERQPIQTTAGSVIMVALSDLKPNPSQPRHLFDEQALAELADSIRLHGVLQPILIARAPDGECDHPYHLIAGERRLRAAELAGLAEVPCIVKSASGREMLELSLIENLRRADLNPVERSKAYRDLMDRFNLTQEEVARRMGEPRATVANYLRILDLCDSVLSFIIAGAVSFGHAKVLAGLAGKSDVQTRLAQQVARENISVRQLEELVKSAQRGELPQAARHIPPKPAYLADVEHQLTQTVGTKVTIRPGRAKNSGRIVIEYYSLDDFDKIVASIGAKIES